MTRAAAGGALALSIAALALSAARADPQQATFSGGVEVVRVDALVLDGQRLVRGLGPSDFQIRDNGVPQKIDYVSLDEAPVVVALVLDASESLVGPRFEYLRAASLAALGALRERDQAALLTCNHSVSLASEKTTDVPSLRKALALVRPGGGTALYDAVHAGIVAGSAEDARTLVLVFSDGIDTSSFLTKEAVLDTARRGDAVVYSAVEGRRAPFLEQLAATTGGTVSTVGSIEALPGLFTRMLEEFRQRYLIGFTPQNVAKGGWHRIDVTTTGRRYSVRARAGYQAGR